jgi:Calcineurin-like phosphoesterase
MQKCHTPANLWLVGVIVLWLGIWLPLGESAFFRRHTQTSLNRTAEVRDDVPFTIIFISDLENKYRGHDVPRSQYVINYVRDLKDDHLVFDEPYAQHVIDPKLVIHGGDISHMWSCDNFEWFLLGGCRNPQDEYRDVWNRLYKAGIPMISAFGNHDWRVRNGTGNPWDSGADEPRDKETDYINTWSNEFTTLSYEKSVKVTEGKFQYEEILPTGDIGQSVYRATFGGIQIVNFNSAFNWQSYDRTENGMVYSADDQFARLSQTLDRSMKTIFFNHHPLNKGGAIGEQTPSVDTMISLVREFGEGVAHFSGHYHVNLVYRYDAAQPAFNDYVAPYPHTWNGDEPGLLAILVSPTQGVLQVKKLDIPGLNSGDKCLPINYLYWRTHFFGFWPETSEDWFDWIARSGDGHDNSSPTKNSNNQSENLRGFPNSVSDFTRCCSSCKAGVQSWSASQCSFVCGEVDDAAEARIEEISDVPDDKTFREEDLYFH